MSLIVLYTFDYNPHHIAALNMLECSIITVKRELGNKAKIYLYTTTYNELLFLNYLGIEIKQYKSEYFGQKHYTLVPASFKGDTTHNEHFNIIGHSRVYIIHKLLQTEQLPILYMDDDTGITHSQGTELLELAASLTYPIGYNVEGWATIKSTEKRLKSYVLSYNSIVINSEYNTINNGIQLFPYTQQSIEFTKNVIGVYEVLMNKLPTVFNDLFAFTCVWHSLPVKKVFIDNISIQKDKKLPLVIHYYFKKHQNAMLNNLLKTFIRAYKAKIIDDTILILPYVETPHQYILNLFFKYSDKMMALYPCLIEFK